MLNYNLLKERRNFLKIFFILSKIIVIIPFLYPIIKINYLNYDQSFIKKIPLNKLQSELNFIKQLIINKSIYLNKVSIKELIYKDFQKRNLVIVDGWCMSKFEAVCIYLKILRLL